MVDVVEVEEESGGLEVLSEDGDADGGKDCGEGREGENTDCVRLATSLS